MAPGDGTPCCSISHSLSMMCMDVSVKSALCLSSIGSIGDDSGVEGEDYISLFCDPSFTSRPWKQLCKTECSHDCKSFTTTGIRIGSTHRVLQTWYPPATVTSNRAVLGLLNPKGGRKSPCRRCLPVTELWPQLPHLMKHETKDGSSERANESTRRKPTANYDISVHVSRVLKIRLQIVVLPSLNGD